MNDLYQERFRAKFGFPPPSKLMDLLGNTKLVGLAPVRFRFDDKPFVVEVQYFSAPSEESNYDLDSTYYRFAVTSDGFDLLVDLTDKDLPIIQDEFGSRDDTGLTIGDLLKASVEQLT